MDDNKFYDEIYVDERSRTSGLGAFMTRVYGWMFAGLALSGVSAFLCVMLIYAGFGGMYQNPFFLFVVIIAEFALVINLGSRLRTMRPSTAKLLYCVYAAVNGISLSYIFMAYAAMPFVIFKAFLMTAVFFGVMTVFGLKTKSDLSGSGRLFMAGLVAAIIASVVNLFLGSAMVEYIICYVVIAVFIGLTAYDTQKMKSFYITQASSAGAEMTSKVAIYGALQLYLDFINIFLYLIRIFGRRK